MLSIKDFYDIKCVIVLGLTRLIIPKGCSLLPGQPWSSHELAHELRLDAPHFSRPELGVDLRQATDRPSSASSFPDARIHGARGSLSAEPADLLG